MKIISLLHFDLMFVPIWYIWLYIFHLFSIIYKIIDVCVIIFLYQYCHWSDYMVWIKAVLDISQNNLFLFIEINCLQIFILLPSMLWKDILSTGLFRVTHKVIPFMQMADALRHIVTSDVTYRKLTYYVYDCL